MVAELLHGGAIELLHYCYVSTLRQAQGKQGKQGQAQNATCFVRWGWGVES